MKVKKDFKLQRCHMIYYGLSQVCSWYKNIENSPYTSDVNIYN